MFRWTSWFPLALVGTPNQNVYVVLNFLDPERLKVFESMDQFPCVARTNEYFAYKERESGIHLPVPMKYSTMQMSSSSARDE